VPIQSRWGWRLVGGDRRGLTVCTHMRVLGSQPWRLDRGLCSGVPAQMVVDGCVCMGADRPAGIKPALVEASRRAQAEPSSSTPLGAVFVGVLLSRRQGDGLGAAG